MLSHVHVPVLAILALYMYKCILFQIIFLSFFFNACNTLIKNLTTIQVTPNNFNKSLQVTLSELDKTWYVSSACGFFEASKKFPTHLSYGFLVKAN